MMKRPLCAAAVFFLGIQAVWAGVLHKASDLKPTRLEQAIGTKENVVLEGTVYRREEKPDYKILYLKDNSVQLKNRIYKESKILVYAKAKESISVGNKIHISGSAKTFQEARNPGNFNQKPYYQKMGIHVSVWTDEIQIIGKKVYRIREYLARLRTDWKRVLIECMGEYYGNCMSAILLGDKSELDSELKALYQKSGIGHILAISGLHMSFLGSGLYKLLRKTGLPFLAAGTIGILLLTGYTLMIGCGVSSLRALTMLIVRIGADICGRDYDMPTSLALSAAAITAWQPLYLMDAGFLLSFGALFGIVCVSPCISFCLQKQEKKNRLLENLSSSLAVNITLLPIMLYFYFEFPTYSILLNLLILPFMSVVLGAGVIGSLLYLLVGKTGGVILFISKGLLLFYETACRFSLQMPRSRIVTGQPQKWGVALYYLVLLLLCFFIYRHKHRKKYGMTTMCFVRKKKVIFGKGVSVLLLCILFSACPAFSRDGRVEVTMLDVGQGDGLYLKGPLGRSYFIDGGSSDVSSVGQYRIEPFLKAKGTGVLDYVFLSHGDADHMNGIDEMLGNQEYGIRIRHLVLPAKAVWDDSIKAVADKAQKNQTKVYIMHEDNEIKEDALKLRCLAPSDIYSGETGNAASMVLELSHGKLHMLFTGDVEGEGEKALEEKQNWTGINILKVAHHGSQNSTSIQFLEQINPQMAWISAGIDNRYGHPNEETISRLDEKKCRIYNTQELGAVTLYSDGNRIQLKSFLQNE